MEMKSTKGQMARAVVVNFQPQVCRNPNPDTALADTGTTCWFHFFICFYDFSVRVSSYIRVF